MNDVLNVLFTTIEIEAGRSRTLHITIPICPVKTLVLSSANSIARSYKAAIPTANISREKVTVTQKSGFFHFMSKKRKAQQKEKKRQFKRLRCNWDFIWRRDCQIEVNYELVKFCRQTRMDLDREFMITFLVERTQASYQSWRQMIIEQQLILPQECWNLVEDYLQ